MESTRQQESQRPSTRTIAGLFCLVLGCSSPAAVGKGGGQAVEINRPILVAGPAPEISTETTVTTAGTRCKAAAPGSASGGSNSSNNCECRGLGEDDAEEKSPPTDGSKRFELRLAAAGGRASLDISGVGTLAASGPAQKCVYVDMPAGGSHEVSLVALESVRGGGIAPVLKIAEYGPKGPFWYDVVVVRCLGPDGLCDRSSADAWGATVRQTKRGRLDPCGSVVVKGLGWETSGGQAQRDGGRFRDFTVKFTMEVKKFATQFAPGSTECVPK